MELCYIQKSSDAYTTVLEVLRCELMISQRLLHKLKLSGSIFLNDTPTFPHSSVHAGDKITVKIEFEEDNSNIVPTKMDLHILYEDEAYLIINKSSGIPVHPSMDHYTDSLSNGLKYYFEQKHLYRKIRPVNRIDKDTSGLVIFAKNEYVQECLIKQMQSHNLIKEYIAICEGILEKKKGTINALIARKENSIIERCIREDGEISITHYEVLSEEKNGFYSVLKCCLETGRTHQIRVHLQSIGHPLLGDTLYGNPSSLISRQALHSYQVQFIHPVSRKKVSYTAPLPEDIEMFIKNSLTL